MGLNSDHLQIKDTAEGAVLSIQAQPGARRRVIQGVHNGRLKVCVTIPAEKGKANQEILEVLAEMLKLKVNQLSILVGIGCRQKQVLARAVTIAELRQRIDLICG